MKFGSVQWFGVDISKIVGRFEVVYAELVVDEYSQT